MQPNKISRSSIWEVIVPISKTNLAIISSNLHTQRIWQKCRPHKVLGSHLWFVTVYLVEEIVVKWTDVGSYGRADSAILLVFCFRFYLTLNHIIVCRIDSILSIWLMPLETWHQKKFIIKLMLHSFGMNHENNRKRYFTRTFHSK